MSRPMPKTLDELVTEALGAQLLMVLRLQAENAALTEKLAGLGADRADAVSLITSMLADDHGFTLADDATRARALIARWEGGT